MIRFGFSLLSILAIASVGCSSSTTNDDMGPPDGAPVDAPITFDAGPDLGADFGPDAGPPDMHVAVCGDGHLDPGESCDDGNHVNTDGCDNMCHRTSFCGDGHVDTGEECDDGENFACDGCAPDCHVEECGNGRLDCGELCDGSPGCSMTGTLTSTGCSVAGGCCLSVTTCGNGTMDAGEQCDDGNTTAWDGCGPDCHIEESLVVDTLALTADDGCDFSGDGVFDNRFGTAFGGALGLLNDMFIMPGIVNGNVIILLSVQGLDDLTATTDPMVRLGWIQGTDFDMPANAANNLMGMGQFYGNMASFDAMGSPTTTFNGGIAAHVLTGGPEDVSIDLGPLPLDFHQARIAGTLVADASTMSLTHFNDGLLCGAIPVHTFAGLPNFLNMFGGAPPPPCDTTLAMDGSDETLADVLVAGARAAGVVMIGPAQPDVDLDHDGLEYYETSTGTMCQKTITACIDGDGTRIAGHDCVNATVGGHPRFADGWSAAVTLSGVHATIRGVM